jgi:copper transport protein
VSTHAIGAVAAVTIAGVAMAWTISPDLDAFVSTRWGISVLAKIGIVGVLVAIGWVNRSRLLPRLAPHDGAEDHGTEDHGTEDHGTEDHGAEENEMVEAKLRTTLRVELVLFAAVVVVTGIVIASSPETADAIDNSPAEPGVAKVHETLELSSGAASVSIDLVPGRLGYNDLYLVVTDAKGAPTVPEFEPTVELSAPEHGIDTIELFVHDLGGGTYHVPVDIPIAGGWEVTIKVRTSTFETGNAQFDVDIG